MATKPTQPPPPLRFKMTKAEAGVMGGKRTAARHGREHMAAIGRRGADTFWRRYRLVPEGTNGFAIVHRTSGAVIGHTNKR